jgi:hypothetical protein
MLPSPAGLSVEPQLPGAERGEVAIERGIVDFGKPFGVPLRVAVLVDDRGADAFDEIVGPNAAERDTIFQRQTGFERAETARFAQGGARRDVPRWAIGG